MSISRQETVRINSRENGWMRVRPISLRYSLNVRFPFGIRNKYGTKRYAIMLHVVNRITVDKALLFENSCGSFKIPYRIKPTINIDTESAAKIINNPRKGF
jgi:hypothetical protein